MPRRNYFEMLNLDCDPAESNKKVIEKAIESWKRDLEDRCANEPDKVRKAQFQQELDLYEDVKRVLSSPKTRNPEAKACREEKIRQLETLIAIMKQGQEGTCEVTNGQLRNVAVKLRLQLGTVKTVYESKGFTVQKTGQGVNLNDIFMKDNLFTTISSHIAVLHSIREAKYPWFSKTGDLYDLACYYCGGTEKDCPDYHKKKTNELFITMQRGSTQYASDMSDPGHALDDLFADGMTQVFNSEENRRKYDQSLRKNRLADFFQMLKSAPEAFKRDRQFAESCIRTIQKQFPDYNTALALYNQEAGLTDPFEPLEALIHLTCAMCRTPAEFRTREEAEKGKCRACGASLYVRCPKCKKMVPADADRCSCGFAISEMRFFGEYKNAALSALKNMDLTEAKRQLENARNAYPGHPDFAELERQVSAVIKENQKVLDELQNYMNTGRYSQAEAFLTKLAVSRPKLRLESQRRLIREKMEQARKQMPAAGDTSFRAGNTCVSILEVVKDFQPAIDLLRTIRPRAPLNLNVAAVPGRRLKHALTWNMAGDRDVRYRVVRKTNGTPVSHTDGVTLAEGLNALEFEDTRVEAGVSYGYAVFAERRGVYSAPAVREIVNYSELDTGRMQFTAEDGVIRISWVLPENTVGVRVLKKKSGIPDRLPGNGGTVAAERAGGNFTDQDVVNMQAYGYRLQCVYPYQNTFKYSEGVTKLLTPVPKPVAVRDTAVKKDRTLVTVTWKSPDHTRREVEIRETSSKAARDMIGQVLPVSRINEILGRGETYGWSSSVDERCVFRIPDHFSCMVAVVTTAGTNGIISGVHQISSVEKCEINRRETRVEGVRLKIKLQELPRDLSRIHYLAAQRTDPQVIPWAGEADARAGRMMEMSADEYRKGGMIVIDHVPREDLYITVIGEYRMPNGQTVYADPSKYRVVNTPKEKIVYSVKWAAAGIFKSHPVARGAKLIVECSAKETPEMKLMYRMDGHIPVKISDPQTLTVCTIPESETGFPSGVLQMDLPDTAWSSMKAGSQLRLLMKEEDLMEYELEIKDLNTLKVPGN